MEMRFPNCLPGFILDVCVHQRSSSVPMTSVSLQAECVMDTTTVPLAQMKLHVPAEVNPGAWRETVWLPGLTDPGLWQ